MTTNPIPKLDLGTIASAILQPLVDAAVEAHLGHLVHRMAILEEILAVGSEGEDNRLQSLRLNSIERDVETLDRAMAPVAGTGAGSLHNLRSMVDGAHEKIDRIHKELDERARAQGLALQRQAMATKGLADRLDRRGGDDEIDLDQLQSDLHDNMGFRDNLASFVERKFDELHEGGAFERKVGDAVEQTMADGDFDEPIKRVLASAMEDFASELRS